MAAQQPEQARWADPRDLPDDLQGRLVSWVARVLPDVATPPPSLRSVAGFAPTRRARLGRRPILEALAVDAFRTAAGAQVALTAHRDEREAAAEDPLDAAALAWLTRPEGWQDDVDALVADLQAGDAESARAAEAAELVRLRSEADQAVEREERLREEHRAAMAKLTEENTVLRRRLGEARAASRTVADDVDTARAEAASLREQAASAAAAAEVEARKLRARITELEQQATTERRSARAGRDEATVRARVLLDTLLEAGQGLRRELGLPAVTETPSARVEAEVAQAAAAAGSGPVPAAPTGPRALEQLLGLPRARLVVDGYNVTKTAWERSTLETQRTRLLGGLAALVARTGAETTVVFDAAQTGARPPVSPPRGVKVLFSPPGVIADDVIRDLVDAEPTGRVLVVVTSDRALADDVRRSGGRVVDAASLVALLDG